MLKKNGHYAGIMRDASTIALYPKLCRHNVSNPNSLTWPGTQRHCAIMRPRDYETPGPRTQAPRRLWGREWRTSGRRSFVKVFLSHWKEGGVSVLLLKSYHDWLNAVYNKTRGFLNLIVWKLFSDFHLLNFIFSANWSMRYRFRFSKSVIPVIKTRQRQNWTL